MSILDQIKYQFKVGSELMRLIYINLAVFLLIIFAKVVGFLVTGSDPGTLVYTLRSWVGLHSNLGDLIFRPWGIFTYMFVHMDFWHLFGNLLLLYFLGRIFLEYLGGKRLVTAYLGGGLVGGLLFVIVYNISPAFSEDSLPLIGASAGVWGIVAAITLYVPNMPIRLFFAISVKLWHLTIFLFLGDLVRLSNQINAGGMIAHIGGALFGYFLVTQLRKGNDWSDWTYKYLNAFSQLFKAKPKLKTVYKSKTTKAKSTSFFKGSSSPSSARTNTTNNNSDQEKLDAILDKIKVNGYDNLSKNEKEFLFKFGKK